METTHRKIELQSPADLTYLLANASTAARKRIDVHFPPNAAPEGAEDPMRRKVEELVDQYIRQTFTGVKQNLSINGMEAAQMEEELRRQEQSGEEVEGYDHRLARRIQDISGQIEGLTLELANLRRAMPEDAARRSDEGFQKKWSLLENRLSDAKERSVGQAEVVEIDVTGLAREEEMRKTWERAMLTLVDIKGGIGGTVARLEKAQGVVDYLEGR